MDTPPARLSDRPVESTNVARERDDDSGKFTEQYPQEEFLQAVTSIENATTARVAKEVGCSYDLAYRRLNALVEEGKVARTKIGSSFIWTPEI